MHGQAELRAELEQLTDTQLFDRILPFLDYEEELRFTRDYPIRAKGDIVYGFGRENVIDVIVERSESAYCQILPESYEYLATPEAEKITDPLGSASTHMDRGVARFRRSEHWGRIARRNERREHECEVKLKLAGKMLSPFVPMTAIILAQRLYISERTARTYLNKLVQDGLARREGKTRGTKYFGCLR